MNILFVCTGNTCRSPMAEAIFNKLSKEHTASSAGIAAADGDLPSQNAVLAMEDMDVDIRGHRARRLNEKMLEDADRIYTMTKAQADMLSPFAKGKVSVICEKGISDPFGGDINVYVKCRNELLKAIEKITEDLKNGNND